ncbi:hypothetical protein KC19_VG219300 [Ceratodon purpureus]|uniref:Uncharacterized protein n=1 Tax=Ceratodon purpureus TaxID=3225 RepID=A0A8T0HSK0_CERPU|nr:hypothetical protein KC19_VG219300 [Ceratodon purpureus]
MLPTSPCPRTPRDRHLHCVLTKSALRTGIKKAKLKAGSEEEHYEPAHIESLYTRNAVARKGLFAAVSTICNRNFPQACCGALYHHKMCFVHININDVKKMRLTTELLSCLLVD